MVTVCAIERVTLHTVDAGGVAELPIRERQLVAIKFVQNYIFGVVR